MPFRETCGRFFLTENTLPSILILAAKESPEFSPTSLKIFSRSVFLSSILIKILRIDNRVEDFVREE